MFTWRITARLLLALAALTAVAGSASAGVSAIIRQLPQKKPSLPGLRTATQSASSRTSAVPSHTSIVRSRLRFDITASTFDR